MTFEQIVAAAYGIHTAMTDNATFPTPIPALPDFKDKADDADGKLAAYGAALMALEQAREDRDEAFKVLAGAMTQMASHVNTVANGSASLINSAGMEVANTPAPIGELAQVLNLRVEANSMTGVLKVRWKKVRGAKSYELETSPDPLAEGSWGKNTPVNGTTYRLTGLTSATRCWVRVRAWGTGGHGAWSDPAIKTVP
jgi:prophage DNA circulation protein